jgi:hypothetical protein
MNERTYFETERAAERHLEKEGFEHVHKGEGSRCRWPWSSKSGLVDADIRFNSVGFFIEYRA